MVRDNRVVFAVLVREVQLDLIRFARDLSETGDHLTGERVQTRQEDVEEGITWILEALQRERERQQQEQQQGGPEQGGQEGQNNERLVPDTAELKLLRRLEVDIAQRLTELRTLYPELEEGDLEVDPYVLEDILRLAERHENTTRLFAQFRERLSIPAPGQEQAPPVEAGGDDPVPPGADEERNQP
jgi:hypothetical protein